MGWASDSLWRKLGVLPTDSTVNPKTYEEDNMSGLRNIPQNAGRNDLVRVCDNRHILGEPITTFYPKSMVQILYKQSGGYDVYVPK